MTFYVTNQNYVVLILFALGAALAILYDAFAIKRAFIKTNTILLIFDDLLFCFISCIAFLAVIFITNYGYIRWYEIIFTLSGFLLYRLIFSKFIIKITVSVLRVIFNALIKTVVLILTPLKFVISKLFVLFKKICSVLMVRLYQCRIKSKSNRRMKSDKKLSLKGFRI